MIEFWKAVLPGVATALEGTGFASRGRQTMRGGKSQKGSHPLQEQGLGGNGAKKNSPEHGKRRKNGRGDKTRHARHHGSVRPR